MAFDKDEIKQLDQLFEKNFQRTEGRFKISEKNTDIKFQQYFTKSEKRTFEIVVQAIEEVIMPRFDNVDNEFVKVRKEMREGFDSVDREFVKVRYEMKEGFKNVKYEIRSDFNSELDKVRIELKNVKEAIFRVGKMLSDNLEVDEKDITLLKKRVNEIDERVRILQLAKK